MQRRGCAVLKNNTLLQLAAAEFDVFLTMDRDLEFQRNVKAMPVSVLVIEAKSNRPNDLVPLVPAILDELTRIAPGTLRRVRG